MLVIRRREGEGFVIGASIEVDILEIDGNQVKIGIRAPRETTILRKEIAATRDVNLASAQQAEEAVVEETLKRLRLSPKLPLE
ncbi:carbon storage regulator [Bryobacter aggregatus]|uniref:carbon storage regulator n=1 Tax=Bryobacter aggregatus TaxID=360054 RepID=UPI0004E1BB88|nr:carbon storage regulator [Bryobacter aggregatus]